MKKPIRLSLIYVNRDFKMLMLGASTIRWSSKFQQYIAYYTVT